MSTYGNGRGLLSYAGYILFALNIIFFVIGIMLNIYGLYEDSVMTLVVSIIVGILTLGSLIYSSVRENRVKVSSQPSQTKQLPPQPQPSQTKQLPPQPQPSQTKQLPPQPQPSQTKQLPPQPPQSSSSKSGSLGQTTQPSGPDPKSIPNYTILLKPSNSLPNPNLLKPSNSLPNPLKVHHLSPAL
ncbi:MAG: hypothetical protein MjAS7_0955 [Metallosphaera javensis (ex Sakai et al. 2022)]|nr:MAG: hypothetical protein MjAS7_0955 [Metallosphaera javensis (ex Sakai et al. 2022)]